MVIYSVMPIDVMQQLVGKEHSEGGIGDYQDPARGPRPCQESTRSLSYENLNMQEDE